MIRFRLLLISLRSGLARTSAARPLLTYLLTNVAAKRVAECGGVILLTKKNTEPRYVFVFLDHFFVLRNARILNLAELNKGGEAERYTKVVHFSE